MKKFLVSMAALAAVTAAAAPAAAQSYGPPNGGYDRGDRYEDRSDRDNGRYERGGRHDRVDRLQRRIQQAFQRGNLTRVEVSQLSGRVGAIANLETRYRYNGYTAVERDGIERRYAEVERRLRYERRDRDYGEGYGYRR